MPEGAQHFLKNNSLMFVQELSEELFVEVVVQVLSKVGLQVKSRELQ